MELSGLSGNASNGNGEENLTKSEESLPKFNNLKEATAYAISYGYNQNENSSLESLQGFFLSEHMELVQTGKGGYTLETT